MESVGFLAAVLGAFADVLDRHAGHDRHDLGQHVRVASLEQHPREARVDRQPGDLAADGGESRAALVAASAPLPGRVAVVADVAVDIGGAGPGRRELHGTELDEQVERGLHASGIGRGQERERLDVAEPERQHLQDDGCQRRPQDLGLGVLRAAGEVVLGVQPDRDARRRAAGATRALLRRRLRHRLDGQPLDLRAVAVAGDARGSGVDHVPDAGDGEARLGDVGGEDDAAAHPGDRRALEHAVLLGGGETPVQGQDLGRGGILLIRPADGIRRVADLGLAGEEDEHVARGLTVELAERRDDGTDLVGVVAVARGLAGGPGRTPDFLRRPGSRAAGSRGIGVGGIRNLRSFARIVRPIERPVPDLDRVRAAGHLDDRRRHRLAAGFGGRSGEVAREALGVDRRRRDDHLEVGALGKDPPQVPQQEVDVERTLVRLVDDDRVVAAEQPVAVDLVEQDAIGDQCHAGVGRHLVGEPHLVADGRAEGDLQLFGDALGDGPCGDAARLRVRDRRATELEADLRQLRRLARSGRTGDDHDLVVADGARDLVPRGADGQLGRVDDDGFDGHSLPAYRGRRLRAPRLSR